jgi:hypothetical protein
MDRLAQDLASGKIKLHEADKKPDDKKPKVLPEKSRLALLIKTHDDQSRIHNRAAQEAHALYQHHKSRGEHEMAALCKELVEPLQKVSSLHRKLHKIYSDRHGEHSK